MDENVESISHFIGILLYYKQFIVYVQNTLNSKKTFIFNNIIADVIESLSIIHYPRAWNLKFFEEIWFKVQMTDNVKLKIGVTAFP